jgi:PAS domain S-box-containing protein
MPAESASRPQKLARMAPPRESNLPAANGVIDKVSRAVHAGIGGTFTVVDANWRIECADDTVARMTGRTRVELAGQNLWSVLPDAKGTKLYSELCRALEQQTPACFECFSPALDSWTEYRAYPAAGGLLILPLDITQRKREQLALRTEAARLKFALQAASVGTFEWDPVEGSSSLSAELHAMFGTEPDDPDRAQKWAGRVDPEDWPKVQTAMEAGHRSGSLEFEYRFHHPERGLRWFFCKGRRFSDDDVRMYGAVLDVTDRKLAEEALRQAHEELEARVRRRTVELSTANEKLILEAEERRATAEALRLSEEKLRRIIEGAKDYSILMLGPGGHILSWNLGAHRIKGYQSDEAIGQHISIFYPEEDVRSGKPERLLKFAAEKGRVEDEGWRIRKDGTRFWANVVITALRDQDGGLRGFSKVTRDITERKRAQDAVRDLSERLLRAQDEERRRLARELHDSTAQTLSALTINLALVGRFADLTGHPRAAKALADSVELAEQASREIRTFSYLLHPPLLDEAGLSSALRWYVDGFVQRTGIQVELQNSPEIGRLSSDVETALFRIAQECLSNVHRHSGSTNARIRLVQDSSKIVLEVSDNGKGLPADLLDESDGAAASFGVGIRGMRERVRQLGGLLELLPGKPGTVVTVALPFSPAAAEQKAATKL